MEHYPLLIVALIAASFFGVAPATAVTIGLSDGAAPLGAAIIATGGKPGSASLPANPSGIVSPQITPETVQQSIDAGIKTRFEAAAGTRTVLTAQQAKDASWGMVFDHFAEVDRDKDGFVTLSDVLDFMTARSPLKAKAAARPVQIIE